MADDNGSTASGNADNTTDTGDQPAGPADLGDAGKRALEAERKNARTAAKERDALAARLKEIEDSNKSELQKALDGKAEAERARDEAHRQIMRSRIARSHGLDDDDMEFVHGSTEDEIEASAKKLAGRFLRNAGTDDTNGDDTHDAGRKPPSTQRPTENLAGGGDPTAPIDETDPAKLAALIPRM